MTRGWPARLAHGEVVVRPLEVGDSTQWGLLRHRNADWLRPWDATLPPGSAPQGGGYRQATRRLLRQARAGHTLPFAIDVEGAFAGQVTVNNVVRGSAQFASIGYWLGREHAGRGVMPTAVALVIDHCLTEVGLHRVEICVRPENTNSLRVVEKLGLREIGYAPRYLHIDGAWRDHRIFAITVEECAAPVLARLP